MSTGWVIFIIVFALGIILGNLLLLRKSAQMKVPESVIKAVKERQRKEQEAENNKKKPD